MQKAFHAMRQMAAEKSPSPKAYEIESKMERVSASQIRIPLKARSPGSSSLTLKTVLDQAAREEDCLF